MSSRRSRGLRTMGTPAAVLVLAASLAACGSSSGNSSSSSATGTSTGSTSSSSASPSKHVTIAVLVGGADNAYQAAGVKAIQDNAAAENATVEVFDAAFNAQKQYAQLQTAINSGKYQGIIINPVDGSGIVPLMAEAKKNNVLVPGWNQPIGSDLTSPNPTVDGVTTQVMFPVRNHGLVMGNETKAACAAANAKPCNVAVMYFQKGSAFDTAVYNGFESVVGSDPNIKVVAEADTGATRQGGLTAAQTILQGHPDVNVMWSTSQSIEGAIPAVKAANVGHDVALLGIALTRQGAQAVAAGQIYGGSQSMAGDEGRLALIQLVNALNGLPYEKGLNPDVYLNSPCADGVTKANVAQCKFDFDG